MTQYVGTSDFSQGSSEQLVTEYEYYSDGQLKQVTAPDGHHVNYFHDPATFKTWVRTDGVHSTFNSGGVSQPLPDKRTNE